MKKMLAMVMAGAVLIGMTACGTKAPTESTAPETTTTESEPDWADGVYPPIVSFNVNGSTSDTVPDAFSKIDYGGITKMENPSYEYDHIEYINNIGEGQDVIITFVYDGSLGELSAKKVTYDKGDEDITAKSTLTKDKKVENGYIFKIAAEDLHVVPIGDEVSIKIGIGENSSMEINFIIAG